MFAMETQSKIERKMILKTPSPMMMLTMMMMPRMFPMMMMMMMTTEKIDEKRL
jgi:hypothetical protein